MAKGSERSALKLAMQDANMSQKEVAQRLGVTPGTISNWLKGSAIVDHQIKALCELLNISADVIVFNRYRDPLEYESEFIGLYRKLTLRCRAAIVQVMRAMLSDG